jgi:hypothetical protein
MRTKRISPATAISLVALFFSLTGAGLAASHYLITAASQIKPSVREALQGARAATRVRGPTGPSGNPAAIVDPRGGQPPLRSLNES